MAGQASDREDLEDTLDEVQHIKEYLNLNKIRGKSSRNLDSDAFFIAISSVEAYFKSDKARAQRLLRSLAGNASFPPAYEAVYPRYIRVLCILVLLGKGSYIRRFTQHAHLSDQHLPFTFEPRMFPKALSTLFKDFQAAQWMFCPVTLTRNGSATFMDEEIVPFVELEPHKKGGTSTIYKARIHEDYDRLRSDQRATDPLQAHVYAVKTYNSNDNDAGVYYRKETEAFARLQTRDLSKAHIIKFYEGFVHGGTYNIILDFAPLGTLEDLFLYREPPKETAEITHFWNSLLTGLCAAVVEFHGSESCYGWHQDIKPSNILVMSIDSASPWKIDFKLADFGLSHFTPTTGRESLSRPIARDTWGAGEYVVIVAPECARSTEFLLHASVLVTQGVDIWSLGCILSEAATWVVSSPTGLADFRTTRRDATDNITSVKAKGCFHDNFGLLRVVEEHHRFLRKSVTHQDPLTDAVISGMIPNMLKSPHDRPTAVMVANKAEAILSNARHELPSSGSSADSSPDPYTPTPTARRPPRAPADSRIGGTALSPKSTPTTPCSRPLSAGSSISPISPITYPSSGGSSRGPTAQVPRPERPSTIGMNFLSDTNGGPRSPPRPAVPKNAVLTLKDAQDWIFKKRRLLSQHPDYSPSMAELEGRDHVFLLDDSDTMKPHWNALKSTCSILFEAVKSFDKDGVDIYFTVSKNSQKTQNIKKTDALDSILRTRQPQNVPCDMSNRLDVIVQAYRQKLRKRYGNTGLFGLGLDWLKRAVRPISIYILTDGRWQDNPESVIQRLVHQLETLELSKRQIGLQFISFGDDPAALERLKRLDDDILTTLDIVDTERSEDGDLWKMLLGPLLHRFDAKNQARPSTGSP